ncbi:zinc finger CCCH domain-containing protein 3 isoform X2 [Euphorbia lathyris]|uniref:zinc finger CCCH domain-containing protein 3 isoform X2 n=2 Tax=Euphorbia lathyris TaxID=212925 RepID=UPI0033142708
MPSGKYYCDYCDKEFQDTPVFRKRHLYSSSHLRAKSLWYNSFKTTDRDQLYIDGASVGFTKGVCNRFVNTGFCPYGDSCKYLHPSNTENLTNAGVSLGLHNSVQSPIVPGTQLVGGSCLPGDVVRHNIGMSWGNLPPSLTPPPEGGYMRLPFVDWGDRQLTCLVGHQCM